MSIKEAYYFSHDYSAASDPKIQALIGEHGAAGYGIYWYIVELLHQEKTHWLPLKEYVYLAIAKQMKASAEQIEAAVKYCILVCDLFIVEGEKFTSQRVLNNFAERERISEIRSKSGTLGAIAKQNLASAKQNLAKPSKGKERKGKEKKENENNTSIEVPYYLVSVWNRFVEMRKAIRKPLTDNAQHLGLEKLFSLSQDHDTQIKIVEQSIFNSYQGLFPLKEQSTNQNTNQSHYREI